MSRLSSRRRWQSGRSRWKRRSIRRWWRRRCAAEALNLRAVNPKAMRCCISHPPAAVDHSVTCSQMSRQELNVEQESAVGELWRYQDCPDPCVSIIWASVILTTHHVACAGAREEDDTAAARQVQGEAGKAPDEEDVQGAHGEEVRSSGPCLALAASITMIIIIVIVTPAGYQVSIGPSCRQSSSWRRTVFAVLCTCAINSY